MRWEKNAHSFLYKAAPRGRKGGGGGWATRLESSSDSNEGSASCEARRHGRLNIGYGIALAKTVTDKEAKLLLKERVVRGLLARLKRSRIPMTVAWVRHGEDCCMGGMGETWRGQTVAWVLHGEDRLYSNETVAWDSLVAHHWGVRS